MVHEVYVPFSMSVVRDALTQPERVARCLPGLQPGPEDALTDARLRVRIGGTTITFRGNIAVARLDEGFGVEARGSEARGDGTVRLSLTVVPRPVPEAGGLGTTLSFTGTVESTGRLAGFEPAQREAAALRLLDRFAEALAEELSRGGQPGQPLAPPVGGIGEPEDNEPAIPGIPSPESSLEPSDPLDLDSMEEEPMEAGALEDAELEEEALTQEFAEGLVEDLARAGAPPEPEADVARRTMIGRSAEEVDHAPPRGRYAPTPAPGRTPAAAATLRWAAPAAALVVASAVVVGRRILRRRR
jgi:carbon monoxide dehydrogenase subunit G